MPLVDEVVFVSSAAAVEEQLAAIDPWVEQVPLLRPLTVTLIDPHFAEVWRSEL